MGEIFEIKDVVYFVVMASGAVAYIVTSRNKTAANEEKLKDIRDNHKEEITALKSRLDEKRKLIDEIKETMEREIKELRECANKCLSTDKADERYVSKRELKLLMDNIDIKIDSVSDKIDQIFMLLKGSK